MLTARNVAQCRVTLFMRAALLCGLRARRRANWLLKLRRGVLEPAGTWQWRRHLFIRVHSLACRNQAAHKFQFSQDSDFLSQAINRMIILCMDICVFIELTNYNFIYFILIST